MPAVILASRFGDYFVATRIGAGAMGVVDAAYQRGPLGGRLVALKRIAAAFSNDPSVQQRFLREASILTRLEHPNVVRTYEVGEAGGEAFIAMELLEGATVSQLQRATSERLPLGMALRIVHDALRGLHAAHELRGPGGRALGLVHQDISPQNLHVAYEGTTRILDFGVARLTAVDASRTDSIRGKPCYLAPEQLSLGSIDRRADLFAMGIILHELLTGAYLFPRVTLDAAYAAILWGTIHPPRATHPDVPEEIDAVACRALARDPAARFETAEEMRHALAAAQQRLGIEDVDVASLGTWVRRAVPPAWTREEVEREVALGETQASTFDVASDSPRWEGSGLWPARTHADDDVHLAATLGGGQALRPKRHKRGSMVLLGALAALGIAAFVVTRDRHDHVQPQFQLQRPPPVERQAVQADPRSVQGQLEPTADSTAPPLSSMAMPAAGAPPRAGSVRPRLRRRAAVASNEDATPPATSASAEVLAPAEPTPGKPALYDQM